MAETGFNNNFSLFSYQSLHWDCALYPYEILIHLDQSRSVRTRWEKLVAVSDPATRFTNKADNYARYRWDFSPQAIEAIFRITGLSPAATAADVGSGTGMLSQHFVERVNKLFAIEPNKEMRKFAQDLLEFILPIPVSKVTQNQRRSLRIR